MATSEKVKFNYGKILVVFLLAWYFFRSIRTPNDYHFINGVNLVIHEAGHSLMMFFGEFLNILGGSLNQVLIPLIFAVYFFRRRENFSGAIILMWVGQSIVDVSHYAADAIVMQLPLLGGDSVGHDWNYLLSVTHLLNYTSTISTIIYGIGLLTFLAGVIIAFVAVLDFHHQQEK